MIHTQDADFTLYQGDVLEQIADLADESVHCVVTSPPYWGLRDYGADGQLGLERTPIEYLENMVAVFAEVWRVLRDDGTLWLNMGDSYNAYNGARSSHGRISGGHRGHPDVPPGYGRNVENLKPKDLVGIPWRLAFALQDAGWYLRSDIIWSKPNPMPESTKDRPTKSHEYLFLLAKSRSYFYDQEAVLEPYVEGPGPRTAGRAAGPGAHTSVEHAKGVSAGPNKFDTPTLDGSPGEAPRGRDGRRKTTHAHKVDNSHENYSNMATDQERWPNPQGRNLRTVWHIPTQPYDGAHFATFPEELVRRCVAAGTSEKGVCPDCGAPWRRIIDVSYDNPGNRSNNGKRDGETVDRASGVRVMAGGERLERVAETVGWEPGCDCMKADPSVICGTLDHYDPPDDFKPVPAVVLDPFMGSGTVAYVARRLHRRAVGIELKADHCDQAARRCQQQSLFA